PSWPDIAAVRNRSRDPVFAFFDCGIGQTNHHDDWTTARRVDLDLDFISVNAVDGGRINLGQHSREVGREFFWRKGANLRQTRNISAGVEIRNISVAVSHRGRKAGSTIKTFVATNVKSPTDVPLICMSAARPV